MGSPLASLLQEGDGTVIGVNFARVPLPVCQTGVWTINPTKINGALYLPSWSKWKNIEKDAVTDLRNPAPPTFYQFLETSWGYDFDYKEKILAPRGSLFCTLFGIALSINAPFYCLGGGVR